MKRGKSFRGQWTQFSHGWDVTVVCSLGTQELDSWPTLQRYERQRSETCLCFCVCVVMPCLTRALCNDGALNLQYTVRGRAETPCQEVTATDHGRLCPQNSENSANAPQPVPHTHASTSARECRPAHYALRKSVQVWSHIYQQSINSIISKSEFKLVTLNLIE